MIRRIPMIRTHGTQIFKMNLTQPTLKLLAHAQPNRELVSLKFTFAGMSILLWEAMSVSFCTL